MIASTPLRRSLVGTTTTAGPIRTNIPAASSRGAISLENSDLLVHVGAPCPMTTATHLSIIRMSLDHTLMPVKRLGVVHPCKGLIYYLMPALGRCGIREVSHQQQWVLEDSILRRHSRNSAPTRWSTTVITAIRGDCQQYSKGSLQKRSRT